MAPKKPRTDATIAAHDPGDFRGFGPQALAFLEALKANNDRDWFAINKLTYLEECDAPLRELVRVVGAQLDDQGVPLAPLVRSPVFRIYRDVRFSKNKNPYRTHIGAALHPEGDKTRPGLLYIHIEPGQSFIAAGFYQPDAPLLKACRAAVIADPDGVLAILQTCTAAGLQLDAGDPLARQPKGFEAHSTSPVAEHLRKRSWILTQSLGDDDLERRDLPEVVVRFTRAALPLLEFFWDHAATDASNGSRQSPRGEGSSG